MSAAGRRDGRRILVLTPFPPSEHALHGGGRVMAQFLAALAERNHVALLAVKTGSEPSTDARLRERCERVDEWPRPVTGSTARQRVTRQIRLARDLVRGIPPWASDWAVPAFHARAVALATEWRPDVIQLEFHVMARHAPGLAGGGAPLVLTEHEPGIVAAREQARARRGLAWSVAALELQAWRRFERRAVGAVSAVVVFTERDRAEVAALGQPTRIVRIPLGMQLPARALDPAGMDPPRLVFVGSFIHPPNVEAAIRLASTILPLARARHPEVVLDIVGAEPPPSVRSLASVHVVVSGTVPEVTPYLDRAAVVVAPLRLGGGMRVKVLEALAAGKALVASPLAVEGLDLADGVHLLLAETDDQFARQIGRLLDDRTARTALAARAREWAQGHHGWERPVAAYEALYDDLIATRPRLRSHPRPMVPQA